MLILFYTVTNLILHNHNHKPLLRLIKKKGEGTSKQNEDLRMKRQMQLQTWQLVSVSLKDFDTKAPGTLIWGKFY